MDYDVVVIGAGPAGACAAQSLCNGGLSVVLIEKATLPRYKTCGGGILRRAMRLLPAETIAAAERTCHAAEIRLQRRDRSLIFPQTRSQPIVYMTMRAELDYCLTQAAEQAGVVVRSGCRVVDVVDDGQRVSIHTTGKTVRGRFVVAADGVNSQVARCLSWADGRRLIPAIECEVTVGQASLDRLGRCVRFDFGVIPSGYAWVFPKQSHLSIGVLSMRRGQQNLWKVFSQYLNLLDIYDINHIDRHGSLIPVSPRPGGLATERVILTGDAAGLADPLTAEGITFAIQSGQLAAECILESARSGAHAGELYQTRIRQAIMPELKASRILAHLIYQYPRVRDLGFRFHGDKFAELVTDIIVGNLSCRACLYKPMNYLKLTGLVKSTLRPDGRSSCDG